jgi:nicotinamidase-related amidase
MLIQNQTQGFDALLPDHAAAQGACCQTEKRWWASLIGRHSVVALTLIVVVRTAAAASVIELWDQVKAPPAPSLAVTTVKASETGFLLLDIEQLTCNQERRPRCVAALPAMAVFLEKARSAHMPIFYSNTGSGSRETILSPVTPKDDEPIVKASVNKFFGTKLDEYLKAKNVKTVIVCGTSAFGAALHTATGAAQHGYKVVLPVDCVPGESLYEEQATIWSLINGPGTARVIKATTLDAIKIE